MGQKRSEARSAYAEAQRESWSALTAEERKARRRGQRGVIGTAKSAMANAQFDNAEEAE
jgi:hypothetical protein